MPTSPSPLEIDLLAGPGDRQGYRSKHNQAMRVPKVFQQLQGIEGLDARLGYEACGFSIAKYRAAILAFCSSFKGDIAIDPKDLAIRSESVALACTSIGAHKLQRSAIALNAAYFGGEVEAVVLTAADKFRAELSILAAELAIVRL